MVHFTRKERPLRRRVISLGLRLVLLACSILAINFFLLPSFPSDLLHFFHSLSLPLFIADCITLCRRQAVWPVYSSVASSPLSFSSCPSPSFYSHSFSSRSFFSRAPSPSLRYPRTRSVPVPRARAIPVLRACAIRSSAPTVSFAPASPLKPVQYR